MPRMRVNTVTGCRLGKRTMKFVDYGKLAATFLNIKTTVKPSDSGARFIARGRELRVPGEFEPTNTNASFALTSSCQTTISSRPNAYVLTCPSRISPGGRFQGCHVNSVAKVLMTTARSYATVAPFAAPAQARRTMRSCQSDCY